MHPDIQRLVELQAVDLRLSGLRSRLAAFPQQLAGIENRLAQARQQIVTAKEALTGSAKDRKKYELDVDTWKEKARKYQEQSFAVKTNEAYKALQHEIQHAEGEVGQAEDRLLERMVAGEEFERQVKSAERELTVIEREAAAQRQQIEIERADAQKELDGAVTERQREVSSVPAQLFETYENIAQRRHGIGISEIRNGACSLCGVIIRPHVFQELGRGADELFRCESCTRILYYIEPPVVAPVPDAKTTAAGAHGNED